MADEESLKKRQAMLEKRYVQMTQGHPDVAITILLNSMHNGFINRELKMAREHSLHYLLLMGIHACILTINKYIFGKGGKKAFKDYLKNHVDGTRADLKFSLYSDKIYVRRNVLAHQWLSSIGHEFGFDSDMNEGVNEENGIVLLNTVHYFDQFQSAFKQKPKTKESIWNAAKALTMKEKDQAKSRIIDAYQYSIG